MKAFFNKISNVINDHWKVPFFIYVVFISLFIFDESLYEELLKLNFKWMTTAPYSSDPGSRLTGIGIKLGSGLVDLLILLMPGILFLIWKRIFHPKK